MSDKQELNLENEMEELKIVQIIICPNDYTYQNALLGLGSDGAIYKAESDNRWHKYFPNAFAEYDNKDA